MQQAVRRGFLLALIGSGALFAGCGLTTGSPQAGAASSPTSSATPAALGQLTGGHVTLILGKQRYAMGDTITVTIQNGLSTTIWAANHQTSCTVVTAERQLGDQWQAVGGCRLMTATIMIPFSAASATVQRLFVRGWPSGLYRVTLTYTGGDAGTVRPGSVVHSAEFTVG